MPRPLLPRSIGPVGLSSPVTVPQLPPRARDGGPTALFCLAQATPPPASRWVALTHPRWGRGEGWDPLGSSAPDPSPQAPVQGRSGNSIMIFCSAQAWPVPAYRVRPSYGWAEAVSTAKVEPPQLVQTFSEQTLQPGPAVHLKCTAAGDPTPEITWQLDSNRVTNSDSTGGALVVVQVIGQFVGAGGEVVSHLNITAIETNDGGLYSCIAASSVGSVRHDARINVYGLPYIRWVG
ncbi:hypothetical protein HAZT_HAZT008153 [Hyalella azteca]|uniref:Ig-like domain-containing protein n=1 Tax=Hyalella azteca TaxID=294128 RepID=A0A6A0HBD8_HYAAZ|nr:hypothetical protein HAZT_HAZT008153 [Hyalella azteca]